MDSSASTAFGKDEVQNYVKDAVNGVLKNVKQYEQDNVNQWINDIIEKCMQQLTLIKNIRPYKYVVTCLIMQKTGAGLHLATSMFWDSNSDDSYVFKFDNKQKQIFCVTTVYGFAL